MDNQLWEVGGYVVDLGIAAPLLSGVGALLSAFAIMGAALVARKSLKDFRSERLQLRRMDLSEEYLNAFRPAVDGLKLVAEALEHIFYLEDIVLEETTSEDLEGRRSIYARTNKRLRAIEKEISERMVPIYALERFDVALTIFLGFEEFETPHAKIRLWMDDTQAYLHHFTEDSDAPLFDDIEPDGERSKVVRILASQNYVDWLWDIRSRTLRELTTIARDGIVRPKAIPKD